MTKDELATAKQRRFAFAKAVYDATESNEMRSVDMWVIGKELGLSVDETEKIYRYLLGEGLLRTVALGGAIGITHRGIVEIESAIEEPESPTEHFPAINYVHIEQMTHSQIQQGTVGSSQVQILSANQLDEIKKYIAEFRAQLSMLNLPPEKAQEAESELATLEAQAKSSKPKSAIIRASLHALKELLMHTAGAAGAHVLLAHLPHFFG